MRSPSVPQIKTSFPLYLERCTDPSELIRLAGNPQGIRFTGRELPSPGTQDFRLIPSPRAMAKAVAEAEEVQAIGLVAPSGLWIPSFLKRYPHADREGDILVPDPSWKSGDLTYCPYLSWNDNGGWNVMFISWVSTLNEDWRLLLASKG